MTDEGAEHPYDEEAEPLKARSEDLSRRKKVRDKLLDAYKDIQQGYTDQFERATDIQDFWDLYNGKLGPKQFYQGNAQIFVPIVYEALKARKTRFVNQLFPMSGRHVECASSDGTLPQSIMALCEHYIRKAHCRSKVGQLILNGDVEGQYTIYVNWAKHERHVVERVQKPLQMEEGDIDEEKIEDIHEETIAAQHPDVEVVADADLLVLPFTADTLQEALDMGGSITILRRWTKDRIEQLIDDDEIDSKEGKALIKEMAKDNTSIHVDKEKASVSAAGIKADGRGKFTLVYETWSMVKTPEGRRLCRIYYGGPEQVLSCKRNPDWADRLPVISEAVEKVQGSFKGRPPVKAVADLQIFANDMINEAADSASFSMLPIIMSDPDKNPRVGSMVLSLAAVWLTSPNDTQFAKFPDIWKEGLGIVAAIKQEIFQALSVNPAMITQTGKKKLNQAEIAQEQQVDILTTADASTILENSILTPMVARFIELDHQYRDKAILVRSFGDLGLRATMSEIPQIQMDHRYEFRWYGVEAARTAQQIQQQIAGLNVIRGIPPQAYQGYKLNLAPAIAQMMENLFGPRLAPLIFQDMKSQLGIDPKIEVELAMQGIEVPVNPLDNHAEAMKLLMQALQQTKDPSGVIRVQILKHQQIMIQQAQAQQQQAIQGPQGQQGGGGTKPGAQPAQATGGQGPPGMIHQDQIPQGMPRRAA